MSKHDPSKHEVGKVEGLEGKGSTYTRYTGKGPLLQGASNEPFSAAETQRWEQEMSRKETEGAVGVRGHPRCFTEELTRCSAGESLSVFAGWPVCLLSYSPG